MTAIMRYVLVIVVSLVVVVALITILSASSGSVEKTALSNINLSLGG